MDEYTKEQIKELFRKYDTNCNGILEKEEFCKGFYQLVKSLAEGQTDEEIQKIADEAVEKFDLNHNGQIEINEFFQLMNFLIDEKGLTIDDLN